VRGLRANISAEAGARQTYEAIKACDDDGTKKTLVHLLTRDPARCRNLKDYYS
jgi:Mn-containing catalase